MHNITVRFKAEQEAEKMINFLQSNSHLLSEFKNDNNNVSGKFDVMFSYALPHQVPEDIKRQFINMRTPEIAPYVWKLGCWMSFRSSFRMGLDPVMYFDDELFKLVIHPTGRDMEIHITPEGLPVERGISATWKYLHRNKEHNENVFRKIVNAWLSLEGN